jgi:hypothetical protein
MSAVDWSKAPSDATHAGIAGKLTAWYKVCGDTIYYLYSDDFARGQDWDSVAGDPAHLPLIERQQAWNGQGLPPVGTVCEVDIWESWYRCEVIAHFQQRCGMVAAFTVEVANGVKSLDAFGADSFRPIRTPEQIEKAKAIGAWLDLVSDEYGAGVSAECVSVLMSAGWRKAGEE